MKVATNLTDVLGIGFVLDLATAYLMWLNQLKF